MQLVGVAGERDRGAVGRDGAPGRLAGAQRVEQAQGVAVDVDDDQVGVAVDELVERGVAVGDRLDLVAVGGEVVGEEEPGRVVGLGERGCVGRCGWS